MGDFLFKEEGCNDISFIMNQVHTRCIYQAYVQQNNQ